MAAEQDLKLEGGNAAAEAPAAGGKKKLVLIIVAVALLVTAAVGVTLFLVSGDSSGDEDTAAAEESVVEEPLLPAQYVILKPEFVVSFQVGSRQRFLQVSIDVMTRKQAIVDALNLHEPMIRNDIIRVIGEQNFDRLRTAEGRVELQELLLQQVRQIVQRESGVEGVEALLFTNFVMQ
ncbi:flagellar basal body-associated FliL family protein [Thalassolituus hydrocarboniclasticus]|uniref:Flagellar protein FliL n=1 Tax=Thalassolituus hydrocarboniclasticus TaxID=2742796 RepID=A0ABY6ABX8_9GAMM|nr:flagellar basal body-associated FliL family protein [Thalassolituus hydrocarboniclasticus]UXD88227.1 flagellar basal body-associated FliL family protein [Thalassolituus hydrocarboniclasticus]